MLCIEERQPAQLKRVHDCALKAWVLAYLIGYLLRVAFHKCRRHEDRWQLYAYFCLGSSDAVVCDQRAQLSHALRTAHLPRSVYRLDLDEKVIDECVLCHVTERA